MAASPCQLRGLAARKTPKPSAHVLSSRKACAKNVLRDSSLPNDLRLPFFRPQEPQIRRGERGDHRFDLVFTVCKSKESASQTNWWFGLVVWIGGLDWWFATCPLQEPPVKRMKGYRGSLAPSPSHSSLDPGQLEEVRQSKPVPHLRSNQPGVPTFLSWSEWRLFDIESPATNP